MPGHRAAAAVRQSVRALSHEFRLVDTGASGGQRPCSGVASGALFLPAGGGDDRASAAPRRRRCSRCARGAGSAKRRKPRSPHTRKGFAAERDKMLAAAQTKPKRRATRCSRPRSRKRQKLPRRTRRRWTARTAARGSCAHANVRRNSPSASPARLAGASARRRRDGGSSADWPELAGLAGGDPRASAPRRPGTATFNRDSGGAVARAQTRCAKPRCAKVARRARATEFASIRS